MQQFGWESTSDEVLAGKNLSGQTYLITGVSAGLGVETTRALAARGAHIIGTARDLAKARTALAGYQECDNRVTLVPLDLADLSSVRQAAGQIVELAYPLQAIIANAGVMAPPFGRTVDGFESQFGTNHLGHFLLINLLVDLVASGGRVISLSSVGHQFGDIDLSDPNFEHTQYDPIIAYGASKTANALFAVEFDRLHRRQGIRAAAVHPGGILTELARHMSAELIDRMIAVGRAEADPDAPRRGYKTPAQGAATSLWAAVTADADEIGGHYCEDCQVAPVARKGGVRPYAVDPERAQQLWTLSESLVGETFLK